MKLRRDSKSKLCPSDVDEEEDNRNFFSLSHQSSKSRQRKEKKAYVKLPLIRVVEFDL